MRYLRSMIALVCMMAVLSLGASAANVPAAGQSAEGYKAYYGVVSNLIKTYGFSALEAECDEVWNRKGVANVYLYDFDRDGASELICLYGAPSVGEFFELRIQVYTFANHKAEPLLDREVPLGGDNYPSVVLSLGEAPFLHMYERNFAGDPIPLGDSTHFFYTMQDGVWQVTELYAEYTEAWERYEIDGQAVSEARYMEVLLGYNVEWERNQMPFQDERVNVIAATKELAQKGGVSLEAVSELLGIPTDGYTLENFKASRNYNNDFQDVKDADWFAANVKECYQLGLIDGMTAETFAPEETLTVAQATKLAACIHRIYVEGEADFPQTDPWYVSYCDYLETYGVIGGTWWDEYYNQPITRLDFAQILEKALPEVELEAINMVDAGDIPDVHIYDFDAAVIYKLYRAGVLVGSDDEGTFHPNSTISRSEAAAIITRMVLPEYRLSVSF